MVSKRLDRVCDSTTRHLGEPIKFIKDDDEDPVPDDLEGNLFFVAETREIIRESGPREPRTGNIQEINRPA